MSDDNNATEIIKSDKAPENGNSVLVESGIFSDPRIISLISERGLDAFTVYFYLWVSLRSQPGYRADPIISTKACSWHLHQTPEQVAEILERCVQLRLFELDEDLYYCPTLTAKITRYNEQKQRRREKATKAAEARWAGDAKACATGDAQALPEHCVSTPPPIDRQTDRQIVEGSMRGDASAPARPQKSKTLPPGWTEPGIAALKAWIAYRKKIRKALSDSAIQMLLSEWAGNQPGFIAMAKHSLSNEKPDLYPDQAKLPGANGHPGKNPDPPRRYPSADETKKRLDHLVSQASEAKKL